MMRHAAVLLVLGLMGCRDVASPMRPAQQQPPPPPPEQPIALYLEFSKVVLPTGVSIKVNAELEYPSSSGGFNTGTWTLSDSTVATIDLTGGLPPTGNSVDLRTLNAGQTAVSVSVDGLHASAVVTVFPDPQFTSVVGNGNAFMHYSCGLTASGAAYCWADYFYWLIGPDTATDNCEYPCVGIPRPVAGGLTFKSLTMVSSPCAATESGDVYCWGGSDRVPTRIATGVAAAALTAGQAHMCGLASDGSAWCWGNNDYGQLGDGTRHPSSTPVRVATAVPFTAISAGGNHTCALEVGGAVYCWGSNYSFSLLPPGRWDTVSATTPSRVATDQAFVSISAGSEHTCALTATGAAYCWGADEYGQLGFEAESDSTCGAVRTCARTPGLAAGGMSFGLLDVSGSYSCGITPNGQAYCWGGMLTNATCSGPARGDPTGGGFGPGPFPCLPPTGHFTNAEPLPGGILFSPRGGHGGCWIGQDSAAYCWHGVHATAPQRVPGQGP